MNPNVKIVETHADPKKGPSDELVAACREGWRPSISWLVTKEDNSQAIVVVLWRPFVDDDLVDAVPGMMGWPDRRPRREPDPPPGVRVAGEWPVAAIVGVMAAGGIALAAVIALVLSSRP